MMDITWSQPHHNGSETYIPDPTPKLSGKVTVFLRVPRTSDVTGAWVCNGCFQRMLRKKRTPALHQTQCGASVNG